MSDTLSSNNFNVGLAPIIPKAPVGSNPSSKPTKMADKDTIRELSGLSEYNPETGEADKAIEFGDKGNKKIEKPKAPKQKAESSSTEEKPNRHQEWKAKRQEERQAREAAKAEKLAKQQELVLPALRKGDFTGAAKALNITVPELFTLFQNSSLSIPTQQAELTAEEKKAKDEADYRSSLENKVKELDQYKYETVKYNYIKENIEPVFNNKEKYELLNNSKDPVKIKSAVYEYMNQHYNETGEVLNVEDILDTMEDQFAQQANETAEQLKGIKKLSKYFNQAEEAEKAAKAKASKKAPAQIQLQEEEEEEVIEQEDEEDNDLPETDFNVSGLAGEKPFWQMTIQEKVAYSNRNRK